MTDKHNKKYVVALDQGTTSSRAIVFDRDANVVSQAQREFAQFYPQAGWVEHDPMEIWATQSSTLVEALAQASIEHDQVAAIGITNQRETTVVWDRHSGRPIHNAIVWQCRRSAAICAQLKRDGLEDYIRETTGLVDPYPGPSGSTLARSLKLTEGKVHVTDYTNASRTMLFNIHSLDWDARMLEVLDIPRFDAARGAQLFGGLRQRPDRRGRRRRAADRRDRRRPAGRPVRPDVRGTGPGEEHLRHRLLPADAHRRQGGEIHPWPAHHHRLRPARRGRLRPGGAVFNGGSTVQWLRDELKVINDSFDSEYFATKVKDSNGVYLVPAFTGLGAPYWDPYARGAVFGLTRGVKADHLIRATLESIAYQTRDVLDAMQRDAGERLRALRVDGGAVANNFLMQFQADILGTRVERPVMRETTALGAAYLAGLACGFWSSLDELKSKAVIERVFEPECDEPRREKLYAGWKKAVERTRGWDDGEL